MLGEAERNSHSGDLQMAEEIYDRPRQKLCSPNPGLRETAMYIEDQAHILHESGYLKEAAYLVKWACELRQKLSEVGS